MEAQIGSSTWVGDPWRDAGAVPWRRESGDCDRYPGTKPFTTNSDHCSIETERENQKAFLGPGYGRDKSSVDG